MPRITPISWKKFESFLLSIGCAYVRQHASHRVYEHKDLNRPIIVPTYNPLPVFIIKNALRSLGVSNIEYLEKLKKTK